MIYLTRRERFNAAHRLFRPDLTDEENFELYGKCSNPNWHGHNYVLYVTVRGEVHPETGYAADLKGISAIIREITEKVDHKNINLEVDFMRDRIASTENIAIAIWEQLKPLLENLGVELYKVRLEETENNFVEYFGT